MVTGRADRWANPELGVDRNGTLRFASWSEFAAEFRILFMHPHVEDYAADVLESDHYFQGNQTVSDYLEYFRDLIDDAGITDSRYVVAKFRRGLDHEISAMLALSARPSVADPEAWFSLALEAPRLRNCAETP